jgi:hypothetical protein
MPKTTSEHGGYIRFRLPPADKAAFEEAAARKRVSLSAWLRMAGMDALERDAAGTTVSPRTATSKPKKARRGRR